MIAEAINSQLSSELVAEYIKLFKAKFGEEPQLNVGAATETFLWALRVLGAKKTKNLLQRYFLLKDDWVISKGFPLGWWREHLNDVIAGTADIYKTDKPLYVVALSESGRPVCANSDRKLEGVKYTPVLYDEWVKQGIEQKLQFPRANWEETGNDIKLWIENWEKWGFLESSTP